MNDPQLSRSEQAPAPKGQISLPVLGGSSPKIRPSLMSGRRAWALVAVHVVMIGHAAHWLWAGRTVSPVEPSEAMYTLNDGHVNAGFVFFAASLLATLIFGRFVCGWGCHFIAYQDLCAWLLKRVGIKPKPLRCRLLVLGPFALAIYMFVWPAAYRWWLGASSPAWTNHLLTKDYWATFPGPVVAVVTVLVAGFGIVYFLGSKGFCTYACPYGGFFGMADRVSVGRILVSDACGGCGHCTATCTSNVRVHEEVATFGMVVDPGCMKCMDCVSVCPNDALRFGFASPSALARPSRSAPPKRYDFSFPEELWMLLVGVATLLAFRGLYDQIPLLLAMGVAAMGAFLFMKSVRLVRASNVRFQNLQLKRGGRWTGAGWGFALATSAFVVLAAHSGAVQWRAWRGRSFARLANVGNEVWSAEGKWWHHTDSQGHKLVNRAIEELEAADRWGLAPTYANLADLVWLYLAKDRVKDAESTLVRLSMLRPDSAEPQWGLGGLHQRARRWDEAEAAYSKALHLEPEHLASRRDLCSLLFSRGRVQDGAALVRDGLGVARGPTAWHNKNAQWAIELADGLMKSGQFEAARAVLEEVVAADADSARAHWLLGVALIQVGDSTGGVDRLRRAVELDPDFVEAHYDLGVALLGQSNTSEALVHLSRAAELDPTSAVVRYNLAVGHFMAGDLVKAAEAVRASIVLDADDVDAHEFLAMVLGRMGDAAGAAEAADAAQRLRDR